MGKLRGGKKKQSRTSRSATLRKRSFSSKRCIPVGGQLCTHTCGAGASVFGLQSSPDGPRGRAGRSRYYSAFLAAAAAAAAAATCDCSMLITGRRFCGDLAGKVRLDPPGFPDWTPSDAAIRACRIKIHTEAESYFFISF